MAQTTFVIKEEITDETKQALIDGGAVLRTENLVYEDYRPAKTLKSVEADDKDFIKQGTNHRLDKKKKQVVRDIEHLGVMVAEFPNFRAILEMVSKGLIGEFVVSKSNYAGYDYELRFSYHFIKKQDKKSKG